MFLYLDMCCLKRPFDDQSQSRIRLESEAVIALLGVEGADIQFIRSKAHWFENSKNPVKVRALRIEDWLRAGPVSGMNHPLPQSRIRELKGFGFKSIDALHIATAEELSADAFATCDDRLLAAASRHQASLRVRIVDLAKPAMEIIR